MNDMIDMKKGILKLTISIIAFSFLNNPILAGDTKFGIGVGYTELVHIHYSKEIKQSEFGFELGYFDEMYSVHLNYKKHLFLEQKGYEQKLLFIKPGLGYLNLTAHSHTGHLFLASFKFGSELNITKWMGIRGSIGVFMPFMERSFQIDHEVGQLYPSFNFGLFFRG